MPAIGCAYGTLPLLCVSLPKRVATRGAYSTAAGRDPLSPLRPLQSTKSTKRNQLNDITAAAYAATRLREHPRRDLNQTERAYIFGRLDRRF
jgi:hypothetical protein